MESKTRRWKESLRSIQSLETGAEGEKKGKQQASSVEKENLHRQTEREGEKYN